MPTQLRFHRLLLRDVQQFTKRNVWVVLITFPLRREAVKLRVSGRIVSVH